MQFPNQKQNLSYQPLPQQHQPPFQQYQPSPQQYQLPLQQYQPPLQQYQPPFQQYQPPLQQYQPPPHQFQPPPQQSQLPPQSYKQSHAINLNNIQKYSVYAQILDNFKNQKTNSTDQTNTYRQNELTKFPHYIYDENHIYRRDYCNGNTCYYYCVNCRVENIKCKARRIFKNGQIEKPTQKDNIFHHGEECNLENLEKTEFYKNQINSTRSKIRDLYISNINLTPRDLHYESIKWSNLCSIGQISFWIKDLIEDNCGKLAHLKYMSDDLIPTKKHLCARIHDEVNGVLIFMTELHEDYLLNSDIWLIDGTFKTAPRNYTQVLNIMGANLLSKTYLTVGHILLKSKKEADYSNGLKLFLGQIASSLHNLRVKIIITDFEKSLLNAIKETINFYHLNDELSRVIKIQGCLFHYV